MLGCISLVKPQSLFTNLNPPIVLEIQNILILTLSSIHRIKSGRISRRTWHATVVKDNPLNSLIYRISIGTKEKRTHGDINAPKNQLLAGFLNKGGKEDFSDLIAFFSFKAIHTKKIIFEKLER